MEIPNGLLLAWANNLARNPFKVIKFLYENTILINKNTIKVTHSYMSKKLNITNVNSCITELELQGLIRVTREGSKKQKGCKVLGNEYYVVTDKIRMVL
jgi:hypothetical protein